MAAARAAEPGAQLDVAFIAYFEAYQEYLTLMQELQSMNGEGHISLARARNNLSRSRNTLSPCIGTLQFPRKMRANWRIESKEEEAGMSSEDATSSAAPPVLQLRLTRPDPTSDDPISAEAEASSQICEVFFYCFSHSTHFSHMSEPILPICHLSILLFSARERGGGEAAPGGHRRWRRAEA